MICLCLYYVFFFQAEDGIRDLTVTGVQTCALPISPRSTLLLHARDVALEDVEIDVEGRGVEVERVHYLPFLAILAMHSISTARSEERRVGKECRSRWSPYH